MASIRSVALLPLLLFGQGCCGLCHLFGCIPEQPIIEVSDAGPERTLATLKAAILHSDTKVLYWCLSEELKREQGFTGRELSYVWTQLRKRHPYITAAGEAETVRVETLGPRARQYHLAAYGEEFTVEIHAYPYWAVGRMVDAEEGEDEQELEVVDAYLEGPGGQPATDLSQVSLNIQPEDGIVSIAVLSAELMGTSPDDLQFVHAGWAWKVRRFSGVGGK